VQEDHDLPNRFLFLPRFLDASSAFRSDAVDFLQSRRGFRDDREDLFTESIDHFLGVDRTDALDHPAAEIFLDALPGCRGSAFQERGVELQPVFAVPHPAALSSNPFSGADGSQ